MDQLNLGLQGAPNDPDLWTSIGWVHCSLGNYDSALVAFDHARRLDPRDPSLLETIGSTYGYFRRHREAIEAYRHAFALAPDLIGARLNRAGTTLIGQASWTRSVLLSRTCRLPAIREVEEGPSGANACCCYYWERRPDSLLSLLPVVYPATDTTPGGSLERLQWTALAQRLRGDTATARLYFDSVLVLLTPRSARTPMREVRIIGGVLP